MLLVEPGGSDPEVKGELARLTGLAATSGWTWAGLAPAVQW